MSTAVLYDSIGLPVLPAPVQAVAGYVDNATLPPPMPNATALFAMYPQAVHIPITALPGSANAEGALVCDCEQGDYTPAQAVAWQAEKAGRTVYASLSVLQVTAPPRPGAWAWMADYSYSEAQATAAIGTTVNGWLIVAVQYQSWAQWDTSVADTGWLGLEPAPVIPLKFFAPQTYPLGKVG